MRKIVVLLILVALAAQLTAASDDEVTLYSSSGKAVAYIADDDDSTIYLWSGKPVAYVYGESVYGFNGKHLGWFEKGIIYDDDGYVVGAMRARFAGPVEIEPLKSLKELKPLKSLRELRPLKPILKISWSDMPLRLFLLEGTA
jgi:hypothetical protein